MQSNYPLREPLSERLQRDARAIHEALADPVLNGPDADELELVCLPNGTHAWLRPERDRRFILPSRYWITDKGRRVLAAAALFDKGPTVAEVKS